MNRITLIGNLTRDPELRVTKSGKQVCTFGLAVNRHRKSEGQPDVDFFNVSAWGALGENCARYLQKGRKCAVLGSVQIRQYDGRDGQKKMSVEVMADEVEFLPDGRQAGQGESVSEEPAHGSEGDGFAEVDEEELPF